MYVIHASCNKSLSQERSVRQGKVTSTSVGIIPYSVPFMRTKSHIKVSPRIHASVLKEEQDEAVLSIISIGNSCRHTGKISSIPIVGKVVSIHDHDSTSGTIKGISISQETEHPSLLTAFPSSHASYGSVVIPSPHTICSRQSVAQNHAFPLSIPSSHTSWSPSTFGVSIVPSPQYEIPPVYVQSSLHHASPSHCS